MSATTEFLEQLDAPVMEIAPPRGWFRLNARELWEYRELLFFFVWRDLKVRYKQTAIGVAWAVLQPFLTMIVFTLFFGALAKIPSNSLPYPVFYYCAMLPWTWFADRAPPRSISVSETLSIGSGLETGSGKKR